MIVKHNNPCGVALGERAIDAYRRALECDPMSAYGGVVALSSRVDLELARALAEQFIEVLFATGYDEDALEILARRKNVRVLEKGDPRRWTVEKDIRLVTGALLVQDRDVVSEQREEHAGRLTTRARPTRTSGEDLTSVLPGSVCAHVRSNAIVLARHRATVGIGAGQMSRVDSVRARGRSKAHARKARSPARCSPPTRTSRSPTAQSSRSRPASRR